MIRKLLLTLAAILTVGLAAAPGAAAQTKISCPDWQNTNPNGVWYFNQHRVNSTVVAVGFGSKLGGYVDIYYLIPNVGWKYIDEYAVINQFNPPYYGGTWQLSWAAGLPHTYMLRSIANQGDVLPQSDWFVWANTTDGRNYCHTHTFSIA